MQNSAIKHKLPLLIRALGGEKTERVPIWFMRQAGRYLPEYHAVRRNYDFMELCRDVESATRVSLQPYERFDLDGIIMFNDILTPFSGAGIRLYFEEKRGPVIEDTFRNEKDLDLLENFDAQRDTNFVAQILSSIKTEIGKIAGEREAPGLLGFAGAPFTMASYLIEGGGTKNFAKTKAFLFSCTDLYHRLADRIAEITIDYLLMQIRNGADAVQIFDSWGGVLSSDHYNEFARPYTEKIIARVRAETTIPVILFVGNSAHILSDMTAQKPSALSLDWRISPETALRITPSEMALQGNMDPLILYGPPDRVSFETERILQGFADRAGYVFNLGHGILPETPIESVEAMVRTVRHRSIV